MKLTTDEIIKWVKENNAVPKKVMDNIDNLKRKDILKWIDQGNIINLIALYKEKCLSVDRNANLRELCINNEICGLDITDNPIKRKAIICTDCPLSTKES